jgi:acetolactate synthase-1/2/3 large subunit
MATAAQENLSLVLLVFNDRGYGVIRNIQKAGDGGRVFGVDLQAPGLTRLAETFGFEAFHVDAPAAFGPALRAALEAGKPSLVEVDMEAIGPYAAPFGGPVLDKSH